MVFIFNSTVFIETHCTSKHICLKNYYTHNQINNRKKDEKFNDLFRSWGIYDSVILFVDFSTEKGATDMAFAVFMSIV